MPVAVLADSTPKSKHRRARPRFPKPSNTPSISSVSERATRPGFPRHTRLTLPRLVVKFCGGRARGGSSVRSEFAEELGEEEMAGEKCGATTGCELCGAVAAVHCAADSAFLCLSCDAKVHGANFLASRHLRRRLDAEEEDKESGSTDLDSESSSSCCVSTADSCVSSHAAAVAPRGVAAVVGRRRGGRKTRRARAELVLEGWAKRMGLASGAARRRAAKAAGALRALGRGVTAAHVPLRVAMAAALWSEIAAAGTGCGEAALLRRLEASAHVPARLVVTVASWMARAARQASAAGAKEGWAECS